MYFDYTMGTNWNLLGFVNGTRSDNSGIQGNYLSIVDNPISNANVLLTPARARARNQRR